MVIFFCIPLGYGWGYRGRGPWYRRRRGGSAMGRGGPLPGNVPANTGSPDNGVGYGWWGGIVLWIIFVVAIIWLIAAWG